MNTSSMIRVCGVGQFPEIDLGELLLYIETVFLSVLLLVYIST